MAGRKPENQQYKWQEESIFHETSLLDLMVLSYSKLMRALIFFLSLHQIDNNVEARELSALAP